MLLVVVDRLNLESILAAQDIIVDLIPLTFNLLCIELCLNLAIIIWECSNWFKRERDFSEVA